MKRISDQRRGCWIRLHEEPSEADIAQLIDLLSRLRLHRPEAFKRILGAVTCDQPNQIHRKYLKVVYPETS
jgi:hypothetical protein